MKRRAPVAVAVICILAGTLTATAVSEDTNHNSSQPCKVEAFDIFAGKVWDQARWRRGAPPKSIRRLQREKLKCQPLHARKRMQDFWREVKHDYNITRRSHLWAAHVKPFVGPDGRHWAIPWHYVNCESGGDYYIGYAGAYGLTAPAWNGYGGLEFGAVAAEASPREQDTVAHRDWEENQDGSWAPYEPPGCGY
jgi:hypothetical protein